VLLNNIPHLDLHGLDRVSANILVNDFINDNLLMKNEYVVIIHGIGSGVLKKSVHELLKHNRYVLEYKIDPFNIGQTIVKLRSEDNVYRRI